MKRFEFIVPCFVLFFGVLVDMFGRGYVTTDALLLQGNSSATLNNASNNVTSIASNTSPTFGLILYSDLISISTLIGDLTMMGDIGMASPSANIRLNPGRDKPAVTITDDNRKLDPAATLAIMFNAYEKLLMHTGSEAGNSGLLSLFRRSCLTAGSGQIYQPGQRAGSVGMAFSHRHVKYRYSFAHNCSDTGHP